MTAKSGFRLFLYALWYCMESYVKTCVYFLVPLSLRRRKNVAEDIVLVTGGGGGLGRSLAVRFAKLGATVVIWDVDQRGSQRTVATIRKLDGQARAYTVDVSQALEVYAAADMLRREVGDVTILVNNAGIMNYKPTLDCPDELIQKVMGVNALAHFWLHKAFLPAMKAKNSGHIVTIASTIAYIPYRHMAPYSSSKCTTVGIHEALELDLAFENSGIKMTMVCPTGMATNLLAGRINTGDADISSPDDVAEIVLEGVLLERPVVFAPRAACILCFIKSLVPVKLLVMLYRAINIEESFLEDGQPITDDDDDSDGDEEE